MQKYVNYCELLGVSPGDSAKQVQQSFRTRIKECHPDSAGKGGDQEKAQLLIEAYYTFKEGVPPADRFYKMQPNLDKFFWGKKTPSHKAHTSSQEKGFRAGKRMFEKIFSGSYSNSPHFDYDHFFESLQQEIYAENEDDLVWEHSHTKKKAKPEYSDRNNLFRDTYYERAEITLRETVYKFEQTRRRFDKKWAFEFIGELTQVQVLYRDICNLEPALTYKALCRVRQINELIQEIRKNVRIYSN